ncbi:CoA transferase [Intrasporangium calvum]|uniref:CoA transferase n=1 Tax=Intrasporangium calvum TaxID=53358 RepID=A0ABT5GE51_9MICO|nr:CoA transferase [Intrasporangium calvum]MDC5696537.1 CoA transferase [Intrasporangium calvum]
MTAQPRPFDGIKVLSFELQVAGPYCTMMLADQGAEVIKVERPDGGDTARGGAPMVTNDAGEKQSGYFLRFNRNKRSLTLDLKSEEGREIFRRLASEADVLVENYRPGLLQEMGLGYDVLSAANPRLIYAAISGFGSLPEYAGKYSKRPAYDIVAQAMGGLMNTCGQAGGPPTWLGVALGDVVSGMNAAHAIAVALFQRERTGRGTFLDISMYDSMVALAERSVTAYSLTGHVLQRGVEPYMAPWGPFRTSDGWIALVVATDRDWAKFCDAMGRPDLVGTDQTSSGPARAANMSGELGAQVRGWMEARTTAEVTEALLSRGLPVGPVQDAQEVLNCEHLADRQLFIDVPDPVIGSARLVGPVVKSADALPPRVEPAPLLGEHTDEILSELGLAATEIEHLRSMRAV